MRDDITPRNFSWGLWFAGFALGIVVGVPVNFFIGLVAGSAKDKTVALYAMIFPFGFLLLIGYLLRSRTGFPQGLLVGACLSITAAGLGVLCGSMKF